MKGGIGSAAITLPDGLIVAAIVAVNGVRRRHRSGNRRGRRGRAATDGRQGIADARDAAARAATLQFGDTRSKTRRSGSSRPTPVLTKTQATRVAQMAHDGFARAIFPSHTPVDGDTIFALATGAQTGAADAGQIGALAADVMADAIVRAVRQATGVGRCASSAGPRKVRRQKFKGKRKVRNFTFAFCLLLFSFNFRLNHLVQRRRPQVDHHFELPSSEPATRRERLGAAFYITSAAVVIAVVVLAVVFDQFAATGVSLSRSCRSRSPM